MQKHSGGEGRRCTRAGEEEGQGDIPVEIRETHVELLASCLKEEAATGPPCGTGFHGGGAARDTYFRSRFGLHRVWYKIMS